MLSRVVIVTDSLGMPRNETPVRETWPEKVCEHIKQDSIVKHISRRGLSLREIKQGMPDFFSLFEPDLLLFQVGIVDSARRAMPRRMRIVCSILGGIPLVRVIPRCINRICSKYHYALTKMRAIHYVNVQDYTKYTAAIVEESRKTKPCKVAFLAIAPPCGDMLSRVYHVREDVTQYNKALQESAQALDFDFLDPYSGRDMEGQLLADGHHLTAAGHELVAACVLAYCHECGIG